MKGPQRFPPILTLCLQDSVFVASKHFSHIRNTVHKDPLQVAELIQLPRGLGMGDLTLTGGRQTGGSGTTLL